MVAPQAGPARDQLNKLLAQLWQQTGDQSILDYINSGWTTPVSPTVQARVSQIVGRQVPTTLGGPSPQYGPPVPTPYGPAIPAQYGPSVPPAGNQTWPDQPAVPPPAPGGGGTVGQGPMWAAYSNSAAGLLPPKGGQVTNATPVGGFFNPPGGQQGPGTVGNETTPGSVGLGGASAAAIQQGTRAGAAAVDTASKQGGAPVVAPFVPTPGSPTTNPAVPGATGAFGSVDPTSAIAQQGYAQAQAGDPTALSAVLTQLLGKFGIDVNRGGIFTPGLVSSIAPYLKTVMEYAGLANGGKPVIPSQIADQFGGMLGGANTFGQIQGFARNLLPAAQGLLSAPAGALADTSNQAGMVNDLLGMLTAGANPIYQQFQQGVSKKTLSDYVQSQLGGPTQNYIDWLRQNAAKTPGSDLLAQIIGGGAAAGR